MEIKELFQTLAEDKDFAAKYQALPTLEAALEETKKDGYSITKEEVLTELQKVKSGQLSDEELASVAGGVDWKGIGQKYLPLVQRLL